MPVVESLRILLVGATGRVGQLALHHWRSMPPACIEIIEQHRDPDRKEGFFWSLQEPLDDRLAAQHVDAIICLAGVIPGPGADLAQNALLAEAVLGAAHSVGIGRVLLASSSAVYGAGDGTPFSETDATVPVNAYGEAKLAMEQVCVPWREAGLDVCCLRIGNVAGADALLLNVALASMEKLLIIDRFSDMGGPVRSYIGGDTLADVLCELVKSPEPLPYILNIATPNVVLLEDLARAAGKPYIFRAAPVGAHQRITLNCNRLAARYAFAADAGDPVRLVTKWKETMHI